MTTPTPRTDALQIWHDEDALHYIEPDACREIERELAAVTAEKEQLKAQLESLKTYDPEAPISAHMRYFDYALLCLRVNLHNIVTNAKEARAKSNGHHCDIRAFLDSVCDLEPPVLEELRQMAKAYSNTEQAIMAERDALKAELQALHEANKPKVEFVKIPKHCDHLPYDRMSGLYEGGDGSFYWATATHYSRKERWRGDKPQWATHFVYFGK